MDLNPTHEVRSATEHLGFLQPPPRYLPNSGHS